MSVSERSLWQLILDVHMGNTGAYCRSREEQEKDKEELRERKRRWATYVEDWDWELFDRSVYNLILVVLSEKDVTKGV